MPSVAVLGASLNRSKFGNLAVRAFHRQGFTVYPVNPKGGQIEGLPAYRSLAEVPHTPLDRISVYLPPEVTLAMLPEIAARGCRELWLNPGSANPEVVSRAESLGLNVVQACSIVSVGLSPSQLI